MKFNEKLKEIRIEKKLSQKQIAEKLEIAISTYADWEQGRRQPKPEDIKKIIKILKISADELFKTE